MVLHCGGHKYFKGSPCAVIKALGQEFNLCGGSFNIKTLKEKNKNERKKQNNESVYKF